MNGTVITVFRKSYARFTNKPTKSDLDAWSKFISNYYSVTIKFNQNEKRICEKSSKA